MKTPMNVFNTAMKKKKKNRKGFSLVELIVVLVIMAILAAALVPTLIGYINQTRQSNSKNECASAVSAAQTILSSAYASPDKTYVNQSDSSKNVVFTTFTTGSADTVANYCDVVESLSEVYAGTTDESGTATGGVTKIGIKDGAVKYMVYTAENGDVVTYVGGKYSVGKTAGNDTTSYT